MSKNCQLNRFINFFIKILMDLHEKHTFMKGYNKHHNMKKKIVLTCRLINTMSLNAFNYIHFSNAFFLLKGADSL